MLSNFATLRLWHYALDFPTAASCLVFSCQLTKDLPKWPVIKKSCLLWLGCLLLKNLGRVNVKPLRNMIPLYVFCEEII